MNWTKTTKGHVYFLNAVESLSYRSWSSGEQPCGLLKGVFFPFISQAVVLSMEHLLLCYTFPFQNKIPYIFLTPF